MPPFVGTMRLVLTSLACCLASALSACGEDAPPAPPSAAARAEKQLLAGGRDAYDRRIASLEGTPVVVNKWASWCAPCRQEFPLFARQAKLLEGKVAFLGVNASDNVGDAAELLASSPLPYDSFVDPDQEIARSFRGDRFFPATAFYDRNGTVVAVHPGAYRNERDLLADIRRFAR